MSFRLKRRRSETEESIELESHHKPLSNYSPLKKGARGLILIAIHRCVWIPACAGKESVTYLAASFLLAS
jgi:hypothetical protein